MVVRKKGDARFQRELEDFERMPESAHLSLRAAASIASLSVSTLRRYQAQGVMPASVQLGPGRVGIPIGQFRQALASRGPQQAAYPASSDQVGDGAPPDEEPEPA